MNTCTKCRQTTNKAHKKRKRFNLGKPIPEGRKVLLENHSKGLLKSKKLLKLRSEPYIVQGMLTNTTYEIQLDKTNKKTVHRNHIFFYYPKEEKIQELVENYVVPDDTDYYTHYNKHNLAKSNAHRCAQHVAISQWPLVETEHTANSNTTLQPTFKVEATPTTISGLELLQTRLDNKKNTYKSTSSSNFLSLRISTPYPIQNMYSPSSPQQENFSTLPDNASKLKAKRKLFPQATHNSPTTSPFNTTPTASRNIFDLQDANELLSRPQLNRKAPIFFGEPITSGLLHKLKKGTKNLS